MINAEGGSRRTPSLYCRKSGFSTFARNTCIFFVGLATFYKILVFPTGGGVSWQPVCDRHFDCFQLVSSTDVLHARNPAFHNFKFNMCLPNEQKKT